MESKTNFKIGDRVRITESGSSFFRDTVVGLEGTVVTLDYNGDAVLKMDKDIGCYNNYGGYRSDRRDLYIIDRDGGDEGELVSGTSGKTALLISSDDWEGLYLDGKLIDEGHSLSSPKDWVEWTNKYKLVDVTYKYLTDIDRLETELSGSFPENIEDFKDKY